MAVKRCRLTTTDNPFNPFTQWRQWYDFDLKERYATCERIAAIACTSDELTDEENEAEYQLALDQIIKDGVINARGKDVKYIKVYEDYK